MITSKMEIRKFVDQLNRFNRKAQRLRATNFTKWMKKNQLTASVSLMGEKSKSRVPSSDSIEAFVLTFRFFIQRRDGISFDEIEKKYKNFLLSKSLINSLHFYFRAVKDELNKKPSVRVIGEPDISKITNRELLEIFIYGYLSHENREKHEIFRKIWNDPVLKSYYWFNFLSTLGVICFYILKISDLNKQVMRELKKL